jgi:hypothetical protein
MAVAVGVNDGALVWTAFLRLPPLAISPIGREVMVVSDGGPISHSQRLLVLELFNLNSNVPVWSAKFFTNRPEEIVAGMLPPCPPSNEPQLNLLLRVQSYDRPNR